MTISIHLESSNLTPRVEYVLDFIRQHPAAPDHCKIKINYAESDIHIYYGKEVRNEFLYFIPCQGRFFKEDDIDVDSWVSNEYHFNILKLFSVENNAKEGQAFLNNGSFGFDLFETIFFHISRYEEWFCGTNKLDEHGMMWESKQILVKAGIHKNPVVDHLVFAFYKSLGLVPKLLTTQYILSHDIDALAKFENLYRSLRALVRSLIDHRSLKGFTNWRRSFLASRKDKSKDPFNSFDFLIVDKSRIKLQHKVLFFMVGGRSRHDNFYSIDDERIPGIIQQAQEKGYSIGLHASYLSFKNKDMFSEEKEKLESIVGRQIKWSRQHFLNFSFRHTPQLMEAANIKKDSSLGYQRLYGFRCGTGFLYHLYDFNEERAFKFKEQPLILMDGPWLKEANENLEEASKKFEEFLEQNRHHTLLTFNFHNTIFDPLKRDAPGLKNWYIKTFKKAKHFPLEELT